jgi:hypothetical protein
MNVGDIAQRMRQRPPDQRNADPFRVRSFGYEKNARPIGHQVWL